MHLIIILLLVYIAAASYLLRSEKQQGNSTESTPERYILSSRTHNTLRPVEVCVTIDDELKTCSASLLVVVAQIFHTRQTELKLGLFMLLWMYCTSTYITL